MFFDSEYECTAAPGQIVDYEVRDTKQHILSKKDDISRGKFSFTSEIFDVYSGWKRIFNESEIITEYIKEFFYSLNIE